MYKDSMDGDSARCKAWFSYRHSNCRRSPQRIRDLFAVGSKSWVFKAGEYVLKTTIIFKKEEVGFPNQWVGELKLLPVEIVITPEMLAIK